MKTVSERARTRATESRLRAIYHPSAPNRFGGVTPAYYTVHNLKEHRKYVVSYNSMTGTWLCHCEGAKAGRLCKHLVRVRDREEKRIKKEALENG